MRVLKKSVIVHPADAKRMRILAPYV